ncbi:MAG: carboxymuconolactone decarboxylase family protein [Limnochordia bacterium]|jgi:AhpD family alkylhydroperoxidase|nr:carboxymuconolactone decarboxylase family protein [Limnochordia bacterium]MDD2630178.1 carboxymuconolactone decarboxylase family protein [Limnochordia bacterium]MDD4517601.1 carboxymuconolactone decarboxylase family protein [Limnochordia bacterium]
MARDPRQILDDFVGGLKEVQKTNGEQVRSFMSFLGSMYKPGSLDLKAKELISIGISIHNRCEYCIVYHVHNALQAKATRQEIMEAAMVAVALGGGPSMAYSVSLLKQAIDTFEPDFSS